MLDPLSYRNHILTKNRQGDAKADEKRYIYPACKMKPPENRGPNLNFLGCFVRYQSTYEQIASTQMIKEESFGRKWRRAVARFSNTGDWKVAVEVSFVAGS